MADQRRFRAPWRAEKMPGGYVVRDAYDQAIALCLQPGERRGDANEGLDEDEACRM
jgi:hypothetical protein